MTISTSNRRAGPYLGDGNQREFPFTFRAFKAEDVRAFVADTQGKERALTYGTDYRVALHPEQKSRRRRHPQRRPENRKPSAPDRTVSALVATSAGVSQVELLAADGTPGNAYPALAVFLR